MYVLHFFFEDDLLHGLQRSIWQQEEAADDELPFDLDVELDVTVGNGAGVGIGVTVGNGADVGIGIAVGDGAGVGVGVVM